MSYLILHLLPLPCLSMTLSSLQDQTQFLFPLVANFALDSFLSIRFDIFLDIEIQKYYLSIPLPLSFLFCVSEYVMN